MADRCPGGWWGRHKLEARYDILPSRQISAQQITALNDVVVWSDDAVEAIASLTNGGKKYVHDICVRCGRTFTSVGSPVQAAKLNTEDDQKV